MTKQRMQSEGRAGVRSCYFIQSGLCVGKGKQGSGILYWGRSIRQGNDETSLEACENYMEQYNAHRVDLTGCKLDQILYVINKGLPVIAVTDGNHAVLLTGYTTSDITYIDPETAVKQRFPSVRWKKWPTKGRKYLLSDIFRKFFRKKLHTVKEKTE